MTILSPTLGGLGWSTLLGAAVLYLVIVVHKIHRLFKVRKMFRDLQAQGIVGHVHFTSRSKIPKGDVHRRK